MSTWQESRIAAFSNIAILLGKGTIRRTVIIKTLNPLNSPQFLIEILIRSCISHQLHYYDIIILHCRYIHMPCILTRKPSKIKVLDIILQKKGIKVSTYLLLKSLVVYGSLNPVVLNPFAICLLAVRATLFTLMLSLKIKLSRTFKMKAASLLSLNLKSVNTLKIGWYCLNQYKSSSYGPTRK